MSFRSNTTITQRLALLADGERPPKLTFGARRHTFRGPEGDALKAARLRQRYERARNDLEGSIRLRKVYAARCAARWHQLMSLVKQHPRNANYLEREPRAHLRAHKSQLEVEYLERRLATLAKKMGLQ